MLGKAALEGNGKDYTNCTSTPEASAYSHKSYMNYINFQGNSQARQIQREPDHVALYTLNVNSHPNPKNNPNNLTINRNPYINGPVELRKDPPKQALARNSSTKQQFACRQSQELIRNKTETLKSGHKSNSISSKGLNNSMNKTTNQISDYNTEFGSPNYNQTVDLGSISRNQSINQSIVPEDELLKQKIEYIQFLQQSLRDFEKSQDVRVLQNLNESNRLLLLRYFEEINRQKDERSRKTISDCVSQSDNFSEDNYSIDARSDSRNTSLRIQSEKNSKFIDGFSKIRDKSHEKESELTIEMKLNEKLQRQYQELMKSSNKISKEFKKIDEQIKTIDSQTGKLQIKNQEIKSKLNGSPFYQEWMLMSDEAEGAKKLEIRLKQELKIRKTKLAEVKQESNNGSTEECNNFRKSQQVKSKEKQQQSRERQGSLSKNPIVKSKMQPIPMPNRSSGPLLNDPTGNRVIQDSSLRIMGVSHQSRNKSINRSTNN